MRKEDLFKKNHILGIEFDRYVLENQDLWRRYLMGLRSSFSRRMTRNSVRKI